jgi:ketosteroid isomerase-like protein
MKGITTRRFIGVVSVLLAAALVSPIASAADADDVRAVVDEYLATEGNLERQARLMTDDRSFIAGGFRQTDNVTNMKNQQAAAKRNQELDPDTRLSVTGEDIIVRMIGDDAAVASFYRFWTVLASAESVRAGRNPQGPPNDAVTLVLAKMGNDWKIVHTHQTPVGGN